MMLRKASLWLLAGLFITLGSCRQVDDEISCTSVLNPPARRTAMDEYIEREITSPYNIQIYYRYTESEIGRNWVTSPANEYNSLQFVNVLKYLFLEPYTEVMGVDFVRRFTPQAFVLTGLLAYNPPPSNSNTRASTINGVKIIFMNINSFDFPSLGQYYHTLDSLQGALKTDPSAQANYDQWKTWLEGQNTSYLDRLKDVYLRTMYHEAAHTFHQRKEPTTDFDKITSLDYRQADWISGWTREGKKSIEYGFITNYASQEPHEDFAELFGNYVILSAEEWEAKLASADVIPAGRTRSGRSIIEEKIKIIKDYMINTWGLDMDKLREQIQKRYPDFARQDLNSMTTSPKTKQ
ncbi:substrate import-associated zinc metallohydrolase lipoprotein [Porphyromonas sp.]